ncbi:unnamed protein product, partial [Rotaria magnacalcarata]
MYRELGPRCEGIDVRVADKKILFDIETGDWDTAGAESVGGIASSGAAHK